MPQIIDQFPDEILFEQRMLLSENEYLFWFGEDVKRLFYMEIKPLDHSHHYMKIDNKFYVKIRDYSVHHIQVKNATNEGLINWKWKEKLVESNEIFISGRGNFPLKVYSMKTIFC